MGLRKNEREVANSIRLVLPPCSDSVSHSKIIEMMHVNASPTRKSILVHNCTDATKVKLACTNHDELSPEVC